MAHVPRCLVDDLAPPVLSLPEAARHHLLRVLRLRPGDGLLLHDGRGGLARATLEADGRARVAQREPEALPAPPVVLAVAPPRGPRLEWLVEKATELEVTRLVPLRTRYGSFEPGAARAARLHRLADEALLQCGRRWRLDIAEPCELSEALATHRGLPAWYGSPTAAPGPDPEADPGRGLLVCIGPEGGFAPEELQALQAAGARPVRLGRTILRVETAAIALAVLALARFGGPSGPDR